MVKLKDIIGQLKAIRLERGLSQMQVAKRMKRTQSNVSKIESKSGDIAIVTLRQYAKAVGAELKFSFGDLNVEFKEKE